LVETSIILTPEAASQMKGTIKSEQPNNRLYNYEGVLNMNDKSYPLDPTQLLLRVKYPIFFHYHINKYNNQLINWFYKNNNDNDNDNNNIIIL